MGVYKSKIGGIAQTAFRKIGGITKCCKFDGVDDIGRKRALTAADMITLYGDGTTFGHTYYAKFRLNSDTLASQIYNTIGFEDIVASNVYSNQLFIVRKNATDFSLFIQGGSTVFVSRETTKIDFKFATYIGTVMEVVLRMSASTGALNFYLNGTAYGTTSSGTLIHPSAFADGGRAYNINVGARQYGTAAVVGASAITMIDCALFKSSYTPAECLTNMNLATLRYKFNDAVGNVITNSGTAGSGYDLTCAGITESAFHTLIKEA